jgi:hypothetical protein
MTAARAKGTAPASRRAATSGIRGYFSAAPLTPDSALAPLPPSERVIQAVRAVALSFPPLPQQRQFVSVTSGLVDISPMQARSWGLSEGRAHSPVTPAALPAERSDEDACLMRTVDDFSTPSPPRSPSVGPVSSGTLELELDHSVTRATSGTIGSNFCPLDVVQVDEVSLPPKFPVRNIPGGPTIVLEPENAESDVSRCNGFIRIRKCAGNRPAKRMRLETGDTTCGTGQLHPFFSRNAAAVVAKSGRNRTTRTQRDPFGICQVDPWSFPRTATAHINCPRAARQLLRPVNFSSETGSAVLSAWRPPSWSSRASAGQQPPKELYRTERVSSSAAGDGTMWAEKYREEVHGALDVLNSAFVAKLTEWLAPFFSKRPSMMDDTCSESDGSRDYDSDGSSYNFRRAEACSSQESTVENIVLLTGPSGAGKTTVARSAARALGLTVIEINAGTCCRSGKRIRDYVGEALVTHRVRHKPTLESGLSGQDGTVIQNEGCNSLIIFEEVDEVFDDERGFWTSILELAEAAGARRPIVLTANRVSADMRAIFGTCSSAEKSEVSDLVSGASLGSAAPAVEFFKHIHIPSPRTRKLYAALRSIAKTECSQLCKSDIRVLTGRSANGDVRRAVNALQFWSLRSSDWEENIPRHLVLASSLHADPSDWCVESVSRAQDMLWTGDLEDLNGHISLVASHFRLCGNSGRLGLRTTDATSRELSESPFLNLVAWVDHCESISIADVIASSLSDRSLATDPRHVDETTGEEHGFGGFVGLKSCATAVEVQSLRVLNDEVDASFPQPDDTDENLSFYYALAALTSPVGGDVLADLPKGPPASARRTFTTEFLPMLQLFATSDFKSRNSKEASAPDYSKPHVLRLRTLRSSINRNHYDSLGLSESASSWLQKSSIISKTRRS